jgi:hypothetical protein
MERAARPPERPSTLAAWTRAIERQPRAARLGASVARSRTCHGTSARPRDVPGGWAGVWATRRPRPGMPSWEAGVRPTAGARRAGPERAEGDCLGG